LYEQICPNPQPLKPAKDKRKVISKTKTKKKGGKVGKKNEKMQKKRGKNIVNYCCNPQ
jgi:hypothetical protein